MRKCATRDTLAMTYPGVHACSAWVMWLLESHYCRLPNGDTKSDSIVHPQEATYWCWLFVDVDVSASTSIQHTSGFKTNWHLPELVIISLYVWFRYTPNRIIRVMMRLNTVRGFNRVKRAIPCLPAGLAGPIRQSAVVHRPEVKSCNAHVHQIFRSPLSKSLTCTRMQKSINDRIQ